MQIDTIHIDQTSLLSEFYVDRKCDVFFKLNFKEDLSTINTSYKKLLYKSYKHVQQNLDSICKQIFHITFDTKVKQNIIGILFDLPIIVNGKEKWSIGFTCPNKHPLMECATKFVIVVSIHPSFKKFGGKHANVIYVIHELGHVFQFNWFCKHMKDIKKMDVSKAKQLRHLTHAIIEWLVDFRYGSKYGVVSGHKFLIEYRSKTKHIYEKFVSTRTMTIMDCFEECMNLVEG